MQNMKTPNFQICIHFNVVYVRIRLVLWLSVFRYVGWAHKLADLYLIRIRNEIKCIKMISWKKYISKYSKKKRIEFCYFTRANSIELIYMINDMYGFKLQMIFFLEIRYSTVWSKDCNRDSSTYLFSLMLFFHFQNSN